MSTVVFGMFNDALAAGHAAETIEHDLAIDGIVHTGHLRETGVRYGGNEALRGGIWGGLVVGLGGSVIATFALGPTGISVGFAGFLLIFLAGSIYGIVAGALAGASEWRFAIRRHAAAIGHGKSLVSCEAQSGAEVIGLSESLAASGATLVEAG